MKKKLLICIQNSYALNQYEDDFRELSNKFDITLVTTNNLVDSDKKEKLKKFANSISIDKFFIVPFYSNEYGLSRNIYDIINTHFFLIKLKKKINFNDFSICISDNKFFIWQRIILETFLKKKCIQIGVNHDVITMPVQNFKELLDGKDIYTLVKSMHKLREVHKKKKKKNNILTKIQNVKKRFLDLIIDRRFISHIFHKRNFNYNSLDFNLGSESQKFDHKITFFYSSFYFWDKWYNNGQVYLCSKLAKCICKDSKKDQILFLSTGKIFVKPFNNSDNTILMMNNVVDRVSNFAKKIKNEESSITKLNIKHHPRALEENKKIFEEKLKENIQDILSIGTIDTNDNITKIGCDYKVAFAGVSSALKYLDSCKNIKIYCLKSLSKEKHGDDYFLKFLNESIIFYDDERDIKDENYKKYQNIVQKKEAEDFSSLILKLCMD
jgi:hypothetical protein